jgi:FlaA1/EpsC-like NDP-sugar epimerase
LLGRPVVDVGGGELSGYLAGATVLVTGAGGSVGAELCARLTRLAVGRLVLVDHAEAALAALAAALRDEVGFAEATPVLADVQARARMWDVLERHRPDVVFHAAAYKQVPLLEASPVEGVATNVLGTKSIVEAARRAGVERLVLFSTDKAVEPVNVLGETKALAEWIVAAGYGTARMRCAAVRLGNVVDSAGSVLPLFRRQIVHGGPLTLTHPEVTRYLITAGEAAGLAIAAGALAGSTGVFWLDSGPPVRVADLARRLVRAAAARVEVEFVGLRPGERLHESLCWPGDEVVGTPCANVLGSRPHRVDPAWLDARIEVLARNVELASAAGVRAALAETIRAGREAERPSAALVR